MFGGVKERCALEKLEDAFDQSFTVASSLGDSGAIFDITTYFWLIQYCPVIRHSSVCL